MTYPNIHGADRRQGPLRILAADDSAVMRQILRRIFERHAADIDSALPPMELVAIVNDGLAALAEVERLRPDVLLLDLEMPRMNGLDVLDRLRVEAPVLPVIMCSALTERGASSTFDALTRGAKDYVTKPTQQVDAHAALEMLSHQLLPKLAAFARPDWRASQPSGPLVQSPSPQPSTTSSPRLADPWPLSPRREAASAEARGEDSKIEIVVIGVSTGGPTALEQLLPLLPEQFPVPVLIVQHMPKLFTGVLAERLNKLCQGSVLEARDGSSVLDGNILIAPGDAHMEIVAPMPALAAAGIRAQVRLHQGVPLNSCKPSVDYLFHSAARLFGPGTLALVLTGMGADGVDGARAIRDAGGTVFAQDEASSAVWGMPGRVVREGIAQQTVALKAMAQAVQQRVCGALAPMRGQAHPAGANSKSIQPLFLPEVRHGLL